MKYSVSLPSVVRGRRGFAFIVVVMILGIGTALVAPFFSSVVFATAPSVVTNVVPVPADQSVTLSWTNPASADFTGTMVRYSTSTFPTSATDGTLAAEVAGVASGTSSTTVTGLTNGTIYYFSLFSYNSALEYSVAAYATQLVMASAFSDDFESDSVAEINGQNGWTTLGGSWSVVDTSGEMTLRSTAASTTFELNRVVNGGNVASFSDQMVRMDWKGSTNTTPGHVFLRAQSASADAGGYFMWQSGGLLRLNYKTTSGLASVQLASGSFTPTAGTWYTYEFSVVNNTAGLPVLTGYVWARGTAKPSTPTVQVTDTINRFSQGVFSVGKAGTSITEYDNVTFYGRIGLSDVAVIPGSQSNTISWTNPVSTTYSETMVRVSTSSFPTSVTDGDLVGTVTGTSGTTSSTTHSGLTNGTLYYYTLFPCDTSGVYGTPIRVAETAYSTSFSDDFDSLSLGSVVGQNGWTSSGGTWTVSDVSTDRVLAGTATTVTYPTNKAINGGVETTDQIFTNRFSSSTAINTAGYVWMRYQSSGSGYLVWHSGNIWYISYLSGTLTTLATASATAAPPMEANVWFHQEISVINNSSGLPVIQVYIWKDGTEKPTTPTVQATDTSDRFVQGSFALGKNSTAIAYYDDVAFYGSSTDLTITAPAAEVTGAEDVATRAIVDENGTIYIPYIQTSTTLDVAASSGAVPVGGGVEFILDKDLATQQSVIDLTEPYSASFSGLEKGTYVLDAYVLDSDGTTRLTDAASHDQRTQIAIGDIINVIGDSVTEGQDGTVDTGTVRNWLDADTGTTSADNRNFPQYGSTSRTYNEGYLSDLNDRLSEYYGYPVFLMNEGRGGIAARTYASTVMTAAWQSRQNALDANKWIIALGINDNRQGDSLTAFQANLTTLLNTLITSYGATPETIWLMDPNADFGRGSGGLYGPGLETFLSVIDSVRTDLGLQGGADFYHPFSQYQTTDYYDNVHPNATGYTRMARLAFLSMIAPTSVEATSFSSPATRSIQLTWDDLSVEEPTIAGYRIRYGTDPGDLSNVAWTTQTSATIGDLEWNTTYYFAVEAYDNDTSAVSYSGLSEVVTATTASESNGFTVSAISGDTTESGGTASFTVVLTSQPLATVTTSVISSNTSEGTVSASLLTFTPFNWDLPQTVVVTGVADGVVDGDSAYTILLGAASSNDSAYDAVDPSDVSLSNTDM